MSLYLFLRKFTLPCSIVFKIDGKEMDVSFRKRPFGRVRVSSIVYEDPSAKLEYVGAWPGDPESLFGRKEGEPAIVPVSFLLFEEDKLLKKQRKRAKFRALLKSLKLR